MVDNARSPKPSCRYLSLGYQNLARSAVAESHSMVVNLNDPGRQVFDLPYILPKTVTETMNKQ